MYLNTETIRSLDLSNVDPLNPNEVIKFLQSIDKPFFEEEYKRSFHVLRNSNSYEVIIRNYLSKINLQAYRGFTFADSIYNEENIRNRRYKPRIEVTCVEEELF